MLNVKTSSGIVARLSRRRSPGVHLHGGCGHITGSPIACAFLRRHVHRTYGGADEIMREIVGRQIAGKR
ncbi:acyl-CoA dehydrogenase family protein [Microbacterium sp. K24]|uniref:acyl-CoA dehydrogenase family protein n=1 Tax=Microbacterium sp. K24 TaxID=2305446 RepID=UPI00109C9B34|nr:acyl-CoA dehydrogenase family protein [Microbacterium sp. K24]